MAISIPVTNLSYPASGSVLTTGAVGASSTLTWAQPNTHFSNSNGQSIMTIPHGEDKIILEEKATLDVKGAVKINGVDLEERLSTIEKVLNIPTRDVTMEAKYPKLADLYKQYMHELEKYKTWERLKGDNNERTTP